LEKIMKNWRVILPFKPAFEVYVMAASEAEAKIKARRMANENGFTGLIQDKKINVMEVGE
jgi:hypothetical protein